MRIVLIGSGNVGTHLGVALKARGYSIIQVHSARFEHSQELAKQLEAQAVKELSNIAPDADIYVICVKDDSISSVLTQLKIHSGLVLHTSGATDIAVFKDKFSAFGVLYPLQTFSREVAVDFSNIPLLIEANNSHSLKTITTLANSLSSNVQICSSPQRMAVHIAAVFACNFTNHCYAFAENILQQQHLNFQLLHPLIMETAKKAMLISPQQIQTGPAIRKDFNIINKHLQFLDINPSLQDFYKLFSNHIITQSSK